MTNEEERESTDCVDFMYKIDERNNTIKFIFSDGTVKTANLGALKGIWDAQSEFKKKAEVVISQLRTDRDRLADALDKIRAEIAEYGSIWVQYTIKGRTDKDIEDIVENAIKQAKKQVLYIIDKHTKEREATE